MSLQWTTIQSNCALESRSGGEGPAGPKAALVLDRGHVAGGGMVDSDGRHNFETVIICLKSLGLEQGWLRVVHQA